MSPRIDVITAAMQREQELSVMLLPIRINELIADRQPINLLEELNSSQFHLLVYKIITLMITFSQANSVHKSDALNAMKELLELNSQLDFIEVVYAVVFAGPKNFFRITRGAPGIVKINNYLLSIIETLESAARSGVVLREDELYVHSDTLASYWLELGFDNTAKQALMQLLAGAKISFHKYNPQEP